jgi:hypothetical protein
MTGKPIHTNGHESFPRPTRIWDIPGQPNFVCNRSAPTAHAVKGSPYGTNFVEVERKDAAGERQLPGRPIDFDVQGRLAVDDGVDVQQATYSTDANGTRVVEALATSEAGEAICMVAPGLGSPAATATVTAVSTLGGQAVGTITVTT